MTRQAQPRSSSSTIRWQTFWDQARRSLAMSEVEVPDVAARRIVESAAGVEPSKFHTALNEQPTARAVSHFRQMLTRCCAGEPLQYVVGSWGFRSLDLMVDRRVLIPRPETEVVAGLAIQETQQRSSLHSDLQPPEASNHNPNGHPARSKPIQLKSPPVQPESPPVVVDLGTGSGAIALSVAQECPHAQVFATDISAAAIAVARANLAGLGRAAAQVTLLAGDWYDALPVALRGSVDVLVSNPPYVGNQEQLPEVVADWEPQVALRAGSIGDEHLVKIINEAPQWLRPDGVMVLEIAPHQVPNVTRQARQANFRVRTELDFAGRPRVLVATLSTSNTSDDYSPMSLNKQSSR